MSKYFVRVKRSYVMGLEEELDDRDLIKFRDKCEAFNLQYEFYADLKRLVELKIAFGDIFNYKEVST